MHTFMNFRPQASRYAYAALRHRVCGAGAHACVINPVPHLWCRPLVLNWLSMMPSMTKQI